MLIRIAQNFADDHANKKNWAANWTKFRRTIGEGTRAEPRASATPAYKNQGINGTKKGTSYRATLELANELFWLDPLKLP